MLEALPQIQQKTGKIQCILPVAESLDLKEIRKLTDTSSVPVTLVPEQFIETIQACDAAIVASGTASLQTALALKPFVIVYQVSPLTYRIARYLAETEYVGLVNVLAGEKIVPELLQNNFTVSNVTEIAVRLLQDEDYRATMISKLKSTHTKLGEAGAYDKAARCIGNVLSREPAI